MLQGSSGKSSNVHQNSLDDSSTQTGPYFDISNSKNVTTILGKTTYLNCRVKNLGNKTTYEKFRSVKMLKQARNMQNGVSIGVVVFKRPVIEMGQSIIGRRRTRYTSDMHVSFHVSKQAVRRGRYVNRYRLLFQEVIVKKRLRIFKPMTISVVKETVEVEDFAFQIPEFGTWNLPRRGNDGWLKCFNSVRDQRRTSHGEGQKRKSAFWSAGGEDDEKTTNHEKKKDMPS
ncbi:hypothetical protein WN51_06312 [Melipona quadrifasciata]|uniref:Uncharacterized protein n=2 Tax=Meliponini TaxID=83319 RepID=A0A0M8ZTE4_9HYME|nr:hypothetical protein WN51_06312 [Melipona quadrifasciata]